MVFACQPEGKRAYSVHEERRSLGWQLARVVLVSVSSATSVVERTILAVFALYPQQLQVFAPTEVQVALFVVDDLFLAEFAVGSGQ